MTRSATTRSATTRSATTRSATTRSATMLWGLALAALTGGCDEVTPESYVELVESSRGCEAESACVLAGEGPCTCASPVNAASREAVEEAAAELDCERVSTTMCPTHDNLRCEAGRCVSDGSP